MIRRPAQFSNLDTALILAATVAWAVSLVNFDAGNTIMAGAEVGLSLLFTAAFLTREVRRWVWELR